MAVFKSILLSLCLIFLSFCTSKEREGGLDPAKDYSGEELARFYCGGCHLYPEPSLLSKEIWKEKVLPIMGPKIGAIDLNTHISSVDYTARASNVAISDSNWQKIKEFYEENAIIPATKDTKIYPTTSLFRALNPNLQILPLVTALRFDEVDGSLYIGSNRTLYKKKFNSNILDSVLFPSPLSNIQIYPTRKEILNIGNIFPNDNKQGSIHFLDLGDTVPQLQIDSLRRPVFFASLDLNNDGIEEKVVCEFGNDIGELSLYQKVNNSYHRTILSHTPGARKVIGYDVDQNGFTDLIVQFCQGDERISIFYNNNMKFTEKVIAKFPPVYGSSSFDTLDFNNDGHLDFYCIFGDNADYSFMLKEYHGLRIFENDGKNQFNEKLFFPMYGATDGKALDFDKDGDIDFVLIAHFADYANAPQNSFIYLENKNGSLIPHTVEDLPEGRWLAIETGDYDKDEDEDIFLGSFALPTFNAKKTLDNAPLIILQNRTNQHVE